MAQLWWLCSRFGKGVRFYFHRHSNGFIEKFYSIALNWRSSENFEKIWSILIWKGFSSSHAVTFSADNLTNEKRRIPPVARKSLYYKIITKIASNSIKLLSNFPFNFSSECKSIRNYYFKISLSGKIMPTVEAYKWGFFASTQKPQFSCQLAKHFGQF